MVTVLEKLPIYTFAHPMALNQSALIERRIITVVVLWLLVGCALAFTWANWFIPFPAVLIASAFVAVVVTAMLVQRKGAKLRKALSVSGYVGLVGMTIVTYFICFAQSLPALITFVIGTDHTFEAKVISYDSNPDSCKFRLVIDSLAPPEGGFCRAGTSLKSFVAGEAVSVTTRQSVFGVHVINFAPAKVDKADIDASQ